MEVTIYRYYGLIYLSKIKVETGTLICMCIVVCRSICISIYYSMYYIMS
jgi:hypothetical protein